MKLYVLTSDFETVAVMDNTLDNALHYFNDEFHRYLENGASTFDLSVVKPFKRYGNATDGTEDDYQYLVENNYLVFTYQDKDYMFNIRRVEETEMSMRVYCQNLSLDLLNEYRAPYTADKQYKLAKYVEDCLYDSGYEIGINEFSSNVRTLKWEGDQTVLARILSIANSFNAEVEFETVLNADRTIDKNLVHFRKRVGVDRPDIELKYGKNVSSIRRTVDIDDLVTGLKVRGHEEDGKATTIKNVVKSEKNSDGVEEFYTRKGSEYVLAPLATQQYGRKNASGGGHIIGQFEYDTKSDTELYNRALAELKKRCVPSYEYEIEGYYDVNIGDTIRAIDEAYNPILILEARVSEQIISFSDPSKNQTKYSNYKVLENKVSQSLLDRVNQLAQMAKILQYGIDFEGSPIFKNGDGTLKLYAHVDRNNVEVTDEFTEYNWTKRNADGTVDEAWTKAHQDFGKIVTVTSDDIDGTAVFSFTVEINGEQAGNATITVSEVYDGTDGEDGVDGIQGPKGEQGIPGETGKDGKTQYTHIAYANSADGTVDFSVSNADRKYIGMYVDFKATDSTNPDDYAWTKVKGQDGTQGTAGKAGADGKTPYFHTAWANSADGKTGFSTTVSAGKTYLGTYTDYTQADSTDPTKYAWSLIKGDKGDTGPKGDKGDDGIAGKDGVGLKSTAIQYAQSTSGTTAPTTGWTNSVPTLVKGQYLWTKTVWTYTDNSSETGYTVSYNAKDGNNGTDGIAGKDGVGISNTAVTYAKATSGTVAPTTGWTATVPSVPAGEYLWTRTIWTYTDNTTETGYSVGKIGDTGATGPQGPKGDKGATGSTGAAGKNATEVVSGYLTNEAMLVPANPQGTVSSYANATGQFVVTEGNKTISTGITFAVKSTVSCTASIDAKGNYKVTAMTADLGTLFLTAKYKDVTVEKVAIITKAKQGATGSTGSPGKDGSDGKTGSPGKDGKGIKSTTITYQSGTSGTTTPTGSWVASPPSVSANQYLWTRTVITYTDNTTTTAYSVGKMGANGTNGKDGTNGAPGKDGKDGEKGETGNGVESTVVTYQQSSSGTTTPKGTWSSSVPNVTKGNYLWTKTVTTYTDNSTNTGYSVSYFAKDGSKGDKGDPTGITVSSTAPSSPYTNQLWKNTGTSDGRIQNATYRYNGSSWELYTFVASNIIADTLSALQANLGDVNGGSYTTEFDRGLFEGSQEHRKGKVVIKDGRYQLSYTNIDPRAGSTTNGNTGGTQIDEMGIQTHLNKPNGTVINATQYASDGILMNDSRFNQYGTVYLRYQDLMSLPQVKLTGATNWAPYASSGVSMPAVERNMRTVTLSGAFKPTKTLDGSDLGMEYLVCTLPVGYRPANRWSAVSPGSAIRLFLLNVYPNGQVTASRNRDNNGATNWREGGWYSVATSFVAADL